MFWETDIARWVNRTRTLSVGQLRYRRSVVFSQLSCDKMAGIGLFCSLGHVVQDLEAADLTQVMWFLDVALMLLGGRQNLLFIFTQSGWSLLSLVMAGL